MSSRITQATVPEPYQDVRSLRATCMALKELVEVLAGQRGDGSEAAVTFKDATDRGWENVTPFRVNTIVLDTAGTYKYTRSLGLKFLRVRLWGGGSAGTGAAATAAGQRSGGGGGGGGAYCEKMYKASDLAANEDLTVGAGGTAVSGNTGNSGTASIFKGMTAAGGTNAGAVVAAGTGFATTLRGGGGQATGGDVNLWGGDGWITELHVHGGTSSLAGPGGPGANGGGTATTRQTTSQWIGGPGRAPGGGGAGSANSSASAQVACVGGVGAPGLAVLEEYF